MSNASEVAGYLTYLAQSGEEPDPLTNLRLQKLLYYVQGWSLALRSQAMFPDRIEAWAHGPVVPSVYHDMKKFKDGPFVVETDPPPDFQLSAEEVSFIAEVWETYKDYSALKLREMTHRETPWQNARSGYAPLENCCVEITIEAMREFFTALAKK
jgi:uncharacterized phage-associated protein